MSLMPFLFLSSRCRSPSEGSDWSADDSIEAFHAQPDESGWLRPEHHQRSRLCVGVLVLRDRRRVLTTHMKTSTVNTLVLFCQCVDQCWGFNIMSDYFWRYFDITELNMETHVIEGMRHPVFKLNVHAFRKVVQGYELLQYSSNDIISLCFCNIHFSFSCCMHWMRYFFYGINTILVTVFVFAFLLFCHSDI